MLRHFFLLVSLFAGIASFAQSGKLTAYLDHKLYYSPGSGNFAEVHYQFVSHTLKYKSVEGGLQSTVSNSIFITDMMDDTVYRDAYVLESPVMRDSVIEDFFDVQRIPLKPGKYKLHVQLQDIVGLAEPLEGELDLDIPDLGAGVSVSDIMVAEVAAQTQEPGPFSKSGYDILPRISNFFPSDLVQLPYYVEVYNTSGMPDSIFGLKQKVIDAQTNKEVEGFTRITKMKTADVVPTLRKMDLQKLPSGSYMLELSVVSKANVQQGKPSVYYFDRVNELEQFTDVEDIVLDPAFQQSVSDDSVEYYLASLIPIARPAEVKNIISTLKSHDREQGRKHIQQFWLQTAGAGASDSWNKYRQQVQLVQRLYSTNFQRGFETDRGRVYLQYGAPNSIVTRENNPSEYPYEIWHYYKIKVYSNKRFIFYNPDLVTNAYPLLHSDMVGELQNYRWQQALAKRNSANRNIDDPNDGNIDHYGGDSKYYYRQD